MKKIWIMILVSASIVIACNPKTDKEKETKTDENLSTIYGKIENNKENLIYLSYNSITDTIKTNENGEFTTKLILSQPTVVSFLSGRNQTMIYCLPKSNIKFNANATDFSNTLSFSGSEEIVNNYLAEQSKAMQNAGINSEQFLYAADYKIFLASLDKLFSTMQARFENFAKNNTEKYPEFVKLEPKRLDLLTATLILTYYTPIISSNKNIDEVEIILDNLTGSLDINNPKMLQLTEFKPFVQNFVPYLLTKDLQGKKVEFSSATEYADFYFGKIDNLFIENTVREYVYYNFIKEFISYYGAESIVEIYSVYKDMATNKVQLTELNKIFSEYNKLAKGQASVNWSFPDIEGKIYSLSDFRGKYVYIDVWAAWCGPCIREIPALESLKQKFADKNIAIIGISIDENRADWINMLQTKNMQGTQLHAGGWNNDLCNYFKITGIPRFILLDKQGNIINSNADRPSGNIEEVIRNLEGI
ncbi:MAG: TlpA disulfide reductase family protein [Bacteroidales bacterium]|nr:TlpA disulfide reductase family protein [Bacteroidales bacterium]MDY0141912.1 TlpA disulfide reductase family protein [Bacteroidales bacterium]